MTRIMEFFPQSIPEDLFRRRAHFVTPPYMACILTANRTVLHSKQGPPATHAIILLGCVITRDSPECFLGLNDERSSLINSSCGDIFCACLAFFPQIETGNIYLVAFLQVLYINANPRYVRVWKSGGTSRMVGVFSHWSVRIV